MLIHFSILILILIVSYFYEHKFRANKIKVIAEGGKASDYRGSIIPWLIVFGYVAILAGMRSGMNDTSEYILSFNHLSGSWSEIWSIIAGSGKDKGFDITGNLFKMFVSRDYHMWFLFFATVESLLFSFTLRKEAISFFDTCFFFFASSMYYNYFSMMRQWMAVVIVFWASRFILKRQFIPYLLFCLLAAQYHNSAYFMIFVYFIVSGKSWSRKQFILIIIFVVSMSILNPLLGTLETLISSTDLEYSDVITKMQSSQGSSWIRAVVAAVPVGLAFLYRNKTEFSGEMYDISINASIVNLLLNVLAVFTSGLYVIRMATYFSIFNLILYPYLLNIIVPEKERRVIKPMFYGIYFIYYIYQMNYSGTWIYKSEFITM